MTNAELWAAVAQEIQQVVFFSSEGRWFDPQIPRLHLQVSLSTTQNSRLLPVAAPAVCAVSCIAPDKQVGTLHGSH